MSDITVRGDQLEMRANLLRERLVRALDEIDRRRTEVTHEITNVRERVHEAPQMIKQGVKLATAAGIFFAGVGLALAVNRVRTRDERLRRERIEALQRFWWHPERIARKRQQGVLSGIARKVLIGAGTSVAMFLLRRSVRSMLGVSGAVSEAGPHAALPARPEVIPAAQALPAARLPDIE